MSNESPFLALPAPFAEALAERGFTSLTPVQERVLEPGLAGRDLRIASQTGSGKTLAVGFAVASLLEAGARPPRRWTPAQPKVLLIAPTRELAAQLGTELGWLFATISVEVVVVAGGARPADELRMLGRGPQVVVGTPGRLLDHLERGAIDASQVRALVLDEADRMLDLGFRDELEAILEKVPAERRTHLVSATFSREVLALAERVQEDAVLVQGSAPGNANEDISHVVHLVRRDDREAALVNLLLLSPNERTLIFVRTRAEASYLAEQLTAAGFYSLPLSGELAQRERNSTLEAFKSGAVRSLVATDVAARGLDIPDVATVVHVEPPTDLEGLTHRSGRTGRAGKKGRSILLVPPAAEERVRSLLRRARIEAEWLPIPSAREVEATIDERFASELAASVGEGSEPALARLAEQLLAEHDAQVVVEALLSRLEYRGPCAPIDIKPIQPYRPRTAPARGAPRRERGGRREHVAFRIDRGENDGIDPRRLLAMICRWGKVRGEDVGAIRIGRGASTFEVAPEVAKRFQEAVRRPDARSQGAEIVPVRTGDGDGGWASPRARPGRRHAEAEGGR